MRRLSLSFFLLFLNLGLVAPPEERQTLTIDVTTTEDQLDFPQNGGNGIDNGCSLREAVETANAISGTEGYAIVPQCLPECNEGFIANDDPELIRIHLAPGTYEIGARFQEADVEIGNLAGDFLLHSQLDVIIEKTPGTEGEVILDARDLDRHFKVRGDRSTVTFRNIEFLNGIARTDNNLNFIINHGGAIWMNGIQMTLNLQNCKFINNKTLNILNREENENRFGLGGAISAQHLNVSSCIFQENSSMHSIEPIPDGFTPTAGYGGAIYNEGNLVIENSVFERNSGLTGIALFSESLSYTPNITGSSFIENRGDIAFSGDVIFFRDSAQLERNLFLRNEAQNDIIHLYADEDTPETSIASNTFIENQVGLPGAMISVISNQIEEVIANPIHVFHNTMFNNIGPHFSAFSGGNIRWGGNIIITFDRDNTSLCKKSPNFRPGFIESVGFNIYSNAAFNEDCGMPHIHRLSFDEDPEEVWPDLLVPFDLDSDNWDGNIQLSERSLARNAMLSSDEPCRETPLDQLGNRRPDPDSNQCDIGAVEMGSVAPNEEPAPAEIEIIETSCVLAPDPLPPAEGGSGGEPDGMTGGSGGESVVGPEAGGEEPVELQGGNAGEPNQPAGGELAEPQGGNAGEPAIEPEVGGELAGPQGGIGGEIDPAAGGSETPVDPPQGANANSSRGCQCALSSSYSSTDTAKDPQTPTWLLLGGLGLLFRRRAKRLKTQLSNSDSK